MAMLLRYKIAVVMLLATSASFAQSNATTSSRAAASQAKPSADAVLDERRARDWRLRTEEWARYRELMQGPLGVHSPQLDPTLRVQTVSDRDWIVTLDVSADEYFGAEQIKRAPVRYPIKVVRLDVDPERNPFGLALDCYAGTPQRIEVSPSPTPPGAAAHQQGDPS
jgi:integrating conjugative element protein (TIGR03746 family)